MRIDERLAGGGEPSFSFEFFPPKSEQGERNLQEALALLSDMQPTFVSVTYGAGGSTRDRERTISQEYPPGDSHVALSSQFLVLVLAQLSPLKFWRA